MKDRDILSILNEAMYEILTFHSLFIWGDGGTFDPHVVFLNGKRRIDGDLVIRGISVR